MRRCVIAGLVVLALVLSAALSLPARLLTSFIDPEQLRLSGLSGTLLHGKAARAMLATPAGFLHLGRLRWDLDAWSLLRLAPRVRIDSDWGGQRIRLTATRRGNRVELRDVDASLRADLLRTLAPLAVDGRLGLQLERLCIEGLQPTAVEGRAVWQDARWRTAQGGHALGSYAADLSTSAAGVLEAKVSSIAGPVLAEGRLRLDGLAYDLDLNVSAGGRGLDAEVERALLLFATPVEAGYRLRLDGELAPVGEAG